jgi:hypothetical protein
MKTAITLFIFAASCLAQTAKPSDLRTAGGYLHFCGLKDNELSPEGVKAMKSAPPDKASEAFKEALANSVADRGMCLAHLSGVVEAFKEGHEHGVVATYFTKGFPNTVGEERAFWKALPVKDLEAASAAMKNDVYCLPDTIALGALNDIVITLIRAREKESGFTDAAPTIHMITGALHQAYPCAASSPSQSK